MIHENNGKEKEDMRRHLNFLAMVHQQILTQDGIGGPTWSHPAFFALPLPSQGRK